jgi:hypothetical protein
MTRFGIEFPPGVNPDARIPIARIFDCNKL